MALDYQTAYRAFHSIKDSSLTDLRKSLYKAALRYAHIRAEWQFMDNQEIMEQDSNRTAAHNRFIDSCNILSRQQALINEDNSWRSTIGEDRKLVGDFACYVNCFLGIGNR